MTTLFVASSGGHLTELLWLSKRIGDDDAVWVTHDSGASRTALHGREVVYVPEVAPRDVRAALRCVPHARRLLRSRGIDRAVSTGAGIALGYLPYLSTRGVDCHYVESTTRVAGPSLTGRVLARLPRVHLYARYRSWAHGPWRYVTNDLDGFAARPTPRPLGERLHVVVMVGTGPEPFGRMLAPISTLLAPGGPLQRACGRPVEVLWQTAGLPVAHLGIDGIPLLTDLQLSAALAAADVVVSHAGVGCTTAALRAGRPPVLVARDPSLGETPDGHQRQFAAELARRGLARDVDPARLSAQDLLETLSSSIVAVEAPPFTLATGRTRR